MLVLTRKLGETIEIPSLGIRIEVVGFKGSRHGVHIGVSAPKDVKILRGEHLAKSEEDTPCHYST